MGNRINLFIDLYELTMMQSYFFEGENRNAVFDFHIRFRENVPRRFYVFCGLEYLIEAIENISFSDEDIEYLKSLGLFKKEFLDYLRGFKFTGDIYSVDEGRIIFPNEPVVEVSAPLPEAQLVETLVINLIQFPILSATKAARCFCVSDGKILVDFGARRAHSTQSAEIAARSSYITGFSGTSLLSVGEKYSIPVFGTMAHSFVMIHDDEKEAFRRFAKLYKKTVLLIDTYDIEVGTKNAIEVIKELGKEGVKITALRIDSGDLIDEVKKMRKILDENNMHDVSIFISGGINEYKIQEILKNTEGVGGFGVGTELTVSADQPYLDCAYKLVEYDGKPKMKLSEGKHNLPGRKKVIRIYKNGKMFKDIVALQDEDVDITEYDSGSSENLLKKVFSNGKISEEYKIIKDNKPKYIQSCREMFLRDFEKLPEKLKDLSPPTKDEVYNVEISPKIRKIIQDFEKKFHDQKQNSNIQKKSVQ
ncbi:MAG: nicotinate phosphoribosyltransferase [Candidatus Calescibacterium sp.]|nr:nicotinate phosphoribosyltransferase [Candidatus Calescibacterium sp.]MCX7734647.1 nicotinate phosphoribosyltransferase [bacterium]MDW8087003.1 nicotinate phosphoribosyltransferase [Candidatus Calescibacterium sp.]